MTDSPTEQTSPSPRDEDLMLRVAAKDQDAFAELVRRHQDGVVNFFRRLGDSTCAEDLAQETFVRLFKYRRKYRPTAKFTTFLYLLARRAWIDYRRAAGRRQSAYTRLAEDAATRGPSGTDALADAKDRVSHALAGLSDEMRMVVVMSIYQGFKYREISEAMDIPLGTVKTRMFHAMKRLRDALENDGNA